ncbi:MAG: hypothetical protein HY306_12540 [Nitrosomonadales bacterium]|nr:hypothetical protein [Nitrosomonadales bacterium]
MSKKLDRMLDSMARSINRTFALICTPYFWGVTAIIFSVTGFLVAGVATLTDFDLMRMRYCFDASDVHSFQMFMCLLFFVFCGLMAIGESFNLFDNIKHGIPHKYTTLFGLLFACGVLGIIGLKMVKLYC